MLTSWCLKLASPHHLCTGVAPPLRLSITPLVKMPPVKNKMGKPLSRTWGWAAADLKQQRGVMGWVLKVPMSFWPPSCDSQMCTLNFSTQQPDSWVEAEKRPPVPFGALRGCSIQFWHCSHTAWEQWQDWLGDLAGAHWRREHWSKDEDSSSYIFLGSITKSIVS